VRGTGPADGAPVTITFGGTCTAAGTSGYPIARTSPSDVNDTANYSGGALPGNGDTLVFENSAVPVLYNLATLTSLTVSIIRRGSHAAAIGLPDFNPTHFETAGTSLQIVDGGSANYCRIRSTAGSAVTAVCTTAEGVNPGQLNQEGIEIYGTPASSVLNTSGASVAFAPLTAQTGTLATVRVTGGSLRTGAGATTTTVSIYSGASAALASSVTTLTVDRNASVTVLAAAATTTLVIESGTVTWVSTGALGTVTVGSEATLDVSNAPSTVAVTGITIYEGCTVNDPNERLVKPVACTVVGELSKMTLDFGTSFTLTVS